MESIKLDFFFEKKKQQKLRLCKYLPHFKRITIMNLNQNIYYTDQKSVENTTLS